MATCGEVLVKLLEGYGVEQVFGIPGVHTVELYRGLAASPIEHVTPRHEQGAGFMADGYARTSGKPGVCFIITGPGLTNITTAMGQAYADSIPMLVISSVQSRNQLGGGRGKLHELPNQSALVAGVAAFSHTLMSAAELPAVLARAFALFQAGRPRPVHIEIPLDVLVENADAVLDSQPVQIARAGAAPRAVVQMVDLLAAAQRPLILAGGGAIDAAPALIRLAERLEAPVALTINAKGMLRAQLSAQGRPGLRLTGGGRSLARRARLPEPGRASRRLGTSTRSGPACRTRTATRAQTRFLETILDVLPDAVLVGDSTQPVYTGNLTLNPQHARRWFNSSTGYGTLGYALPAAIGAWLGRSAKRDERGAVVCLIGDGGLQFPGAGQRGRGEHAGDRPVVE